MAEVPKPFEMKDRFGVAWAVKPRKNTGMPDSAGVFVYEVMLLRERAYATDPQRQVITVVSKIDDAPAKIAAEIDQYINDFLLSGGEPPARGNIEVTASPDGGAWVLVGVLVLLAALDKRRR